MPIHVEVDTAQTLTTTTEAAVVSASTGENYPGLVGQPPVQAVPCLLHAQVNCTPGAASTGLIIRIRHGVNAVGGALVVAALTLPAAGGEIDFLDATGDVNGYTVTAQQVAATGNGTVNVASLDVTLQ